MSARSLLFSTPHAVPMRISAITILWSVIESEEMSTYAKGNIGLHASNKKLKFSNSNSRADAWNITPVAWKKRNLVIWFPAVPLFIRSPRTTRSRDRSSCRRVDLCCETIWLTLPPSVQTGDMFEQADKRWTQYLLCGKGEEVLSDVVL